MICRENSLSKNIIISNSDSLINGKKDTAISSDLNKNFNTYKILTNLNEEQEITRDRLNNFQNELGIRKGMELKVLEIYVDKTSDDRSKWNVIINDTTLEFTPSLSWNNLSEESRDLLDNWPGKGEKTNLEFNKVFTAEAKPNDMFRVIAVPLVDMSEDSKLSNLQKDYTYEIIIVDDHPEQVEIQKKSGLIIKRLDNNRFRIKLSKFNRAEFERWSENRDDDPYVYTTSIILYDRISNQKSKPINLKYTFGEY
jgi:hypothetical protein